MSLVAKLALSPLLAAQGVWTRARVPVLAEAAGPRCGEVGTGAPLPLLIVGDSSAAGVGVARQEQALAGHLSRTLAAEARRRVRWQLVARSGVTTARLLDLLRDVAIERCAVAVVVTGVNDVVEQVPSRRAVSDRAALADWLLAHSGARHVVFAPLPPGAAVSGAAAAAALDRRRRRAAPRLRDGRVGGWPRRREPCADRDFARSPQHGQRRLSSRRAGLSRLWRGVGPAHRPASAVAVIAGCARGLRLMLEATVSLAFAATLATVGPLGAPAAAPLFDPLQDGGRCAPSDLLFAQATTTAIASEADPVLLDGLGTPGFRTGAASPQAQVFFEQGLRLTAGLAAHRALESDSDTVRQLAGVVRITVSIPATAIARRRICCAPGACRTRSACCRRANERSPGNGRVLHLLAAAQRWRPYASEFDSHPGETP